MNTTNNTPIKLKTQSGATVDVYRCFSAADVDGQTDIPAFVLALVTFSPLDASGKMCVSSYTRDVLSRFHRTLGDAVVRSVLRELVVDISIGFSPHNAFGVLISRLRRFGTPAELVV